MIFNSVTFIIFGLVFIPLYWMVPTKHRNLLLLAGSYLFYGWWDFRFLGLLALSTVVDFSLGKTIHQLTDDRQRLRLLWVSVAVNLGILGIFKYSNFFLDSLVSSLDTVGVSLDRPTLSILLPVGISFYTFQTISYSFDIYRRRIEPARSILDFATYVAYFPQLVAGPIERAQQLLPQITRPASRVFPSGARLNEAVRLIVGGLFKKVVLADGAATVANDVFGNSANVSWFYAVIGVLAFAIQIYGDFSGYSDIARGVSLLLGINLVINFTEPYLSRNITEFWRRWHISLSDWLRDYLYIALGGNRKGTAKTYRNLILTMLLGGLWHGASWNFVIWGALHGLYLVVHKLQMGGRVERNQPVWAELPSILVTFVAVNFAWIFFRAATLGDSIDMITAIGTLQEGFTDAAGVLKVLVLASAVVGLDLWQRHLATTHPKDDLPVSQPLVGGALVGAALVAVLVFSGATPQPFIYFQF